IGEAAALKEVGDSRGAEEKLAEIRRQRLALQRHATRALSLALETGMHSRREFQHSMNSLAWLVGGWIVLGIVVWGWIAYDAASHVFAPVWRLEAGVSRFAAGDWPGPIPGQFSGEFGTVATQFKLLTDTLRQRAVR